MKRILAGVIRSVLFVVLPGSGLTQEEAASLCRVVPQANHEVSFLVDGEERLRWHYGTQYPRPFFFPLIGPAGSPLTRMGHPGASNHDHHRSIWFAHHDVNGFDFWSDNAGTRIRQKQWLAYEDGDDEAVMACSIGWHEADGGRELMEQELVASVRPAPEGGTFVEFQSTFRVPKGETVELNRTNFGFLAVRVAKSISGHFGGGRIFSSKGTEGEKSIFGNEARWMDYAGPVPVRDGGGTEVNGITFYDHPSNPSYPSRWHVREDGWMGASVCRTKAIEISEGKPLVLRYLLHSRAGKIDVAAADTVAGEFAKRPGFVVSKSTEQHRQYVVRRASD